MKKFYEAPALFVDEYVADTMIASSGYGDYNSKNGNPNNQNCYGCDTEFGKPNTWNGDICQISPSNGQDFYNGACS